MGHQLAASGDEGAKPMKIVWKIDKSQSAGLLGSKIKYPVYTMVSYSGAELAIVKEYSPYQPSLHLEIQESDFNDDLKRHISSKGADSWARHESGLTIEFDGLVAAEKYKDLIISTFAAYKNQIDAVTQLSDVIGKAHEIDL